ncbi:MAG: hypothetical protein COV30_00320 [Candidatus Yanofskybacteria bacterium CG10_big_fil_rev_8_21_14_0_10_37_15]|uniref:Bacterial surface antigen (D15) domain-containing protein n=1 Tax=Candidatus Yanofskybacteria bacterium CG10_big_fil_rev_8_21_14_0_10_37_15 TaxID=1975097 RepID=A0A2H0R6E9_9BACT|nr:MAG: hypothetical protein COV30_00320 [Candidatus Yanofskybacteria bacterium CG10_big_fil_rev_8_21_14_0_10_37_15]
MIRKTCFFIVIFLTLFFQSTSTFAQFGKNQVIWEKTTWNFYKTAHFDFYFSLDIKDEDIQKNFTELTSHLEGSYEYLSVTLNHGLKKRPIVVVSRTHSTFEALHLSGDQFIPEGVGAYALPRGSRLLPDSDMLLAIKPDFLPVLNRSIYTHELVHIFQFDMIGWSFIGRAVGVDPIEQWLYEATADFLANKYAPYSRDDIRKMQQRVAAANVKNPQMGLPTLEMLTRGQANPYALGAMVFMFLEERYGEEVTVKIITSIFKQRGQKFLDLLSDVSEGEFSSPENFDRAHRDYWAGKYAKDSLERPRPYQKTQSVNGRQVIKKPYPYPLTSPAVSPDGNSVAFLTYNPKNGIVLGVAPTLPRNDPAYIPQSERRTEWVLGKEVASKDSPLQILTTFMPPKHYEYIIGQELNVWPFNGSDLDWWQDFDWSKEVKDVVYELKKAQQNLFQLKEESPIESAEEEIGDQLIRIAIFEEEIKTLEKKLVDLKRVPKVSKIAFFARKNRDHTLFIIDANTGKFIQEEEIPLDQSFSPNFSTNGLVVYFSAARNIQRDIYSLNLKTHELKNLTNGGTFNSAPRVSPDGTKLAYVVFDGGFQKLFLLNLLNDTKEQLTFGRWNDNSPSWSSDGTTLVYTSDERDEIWNLYTIDLETRVNKQWTEYYGGVFTPKFVSVEKDRVIYSSYLEEDQFQNYIYPNFELFDALLKEEPVRTAVVENKNENMELAFRSQEVVSEQLDQNQLDNPQSPPARWKFYGSNVNIGTSSYWGIFASSQFAVQDVLANRTHLGLFFQQGDFRYIDYTYTDRSRRWGLGANFNHSKYPFYFFLRDFNGHPRYPEPDGDQNQFVLNNTWVKETSATVYAERPFNKWSRVEFGIRPRRQEYLLPLTDESIEFFGDLIPEIDRQFYDFFKASNRTNVGFITAFVHDTVLYSNSTLGPLHGDALRAQIEFGPPGLNKESYLSAQADIRKYFRLSNSSLFAVRALGLNSSKPNGEFILLGGNDTLRNYPLGSIAGNQVGYGSAELRFPVADVALAGVIPLQVRGTLFSDYALAKFNNDLIPTRREWSYGFGLQTYIFFPINFEWAKTKFAPDKWTFNFRIGFNF